MTKKELKKWFINKISLCYEVTHDELPDIKFLFYDESFIRINKLNKLNDIIVEHNNLHRKIKGDCIFYIDLKNKCLYCDYDEIYNFFINNYNINYYTIQLFIIKILNETSNLKGYITIPYMRNAIGALNERNKLKRI